MSNIDFNTCTIADVIARSHAMHPSLLAEALIAAARVHTDYMEKAPAHVKDAVQAAARDANRARRIIYCEGISALSNPENFGAMITAFNCAAKLQLIPRATAAEIAARHDAR